MKQRSFKQVDVFSAEHYRGNPVAVVLEGQDLSTADMQRFARWTNLSETTFILPPTTPDADYRLRIFTPARELPFAGHPTLGSCHAWLEAGGHPRTDHEVVQECQVGLVRIKRDPTRLAFAAPAPLRTGAVDADTLDRIVRSLGITTADVLHHQWTDTGPGWVTVMLPSAEAVLRLEPRYDLMQGLEVGVVGAYPEGSECQFEVRAFITIGTPVAYEDPVTGSLNAGIGQWLTSAGLSEQQYVASQGTALGRSGRVHVERDANGQVWVGGDTVTCISGTVSL
ncbi:MAG: PhzF family phenazine biosynthesis protein [Pleurocapsa sp. SU_196_0]|nr:PhzF family phenazine biosynthesis protein [Pleurocapsa sp. SU_196_0]